MTTESVEKLVVNVDEAAKMLNLSRPSAYAAVKRGEIPVIRVGGRLLVPIAALKTMLANAGQPKEPSK